jgi:hypothetical protein
LCALGQGVKIEDALRLALAQLQFGLGLRRLAAECAQGGAVEVFEQLAFPGVPTFGLVPRMSATVSRYRATR